MAYDRANWEPDAEATHCLCCEQPFGAVLRKHHCRQCGRVVCGDCSAHTKAVPSYTGEQRVCDRCFLAEPAPPTLAERAWALLALCPCAESEQQKVY
jgi:hypothetical protein